MTRIPATSMVHVGDTRISVDVEALSLDDLEAAAALCRDGAVNFRATELAHQLASDRAKLMPSAVYVVAAENLPVCKIGMANDPKSRLIQLQNGNWNELSIAALLWADTAAYKIEQLALKAAKEMGIRLRGEWLAAEPEEACEIVLKAARHHGAPVFDSATWLDNWAIRVNALAEARDRSKAIGKLQPRGRKTAY